MTNPLRIAVYGKHIQEPSEIYVEHLLRLLLNHQVSIFLHDSLKNFSHHFPTAGIFDAHESLTAAKPDFLICMGGDGTILEAVSLVKDSEIPVLGINLGRLGFLANVAKEDITQAVEDLMTKKYELSSRSLIRLAVSSGQEHITQPFALNEVAVSRKDTTAMITIHAYINEVFLNTYWADGLIISTPTGSTGYSLSCGGPIIMPDSESFVITPIAPHNLNVRPFVIPNHYKIRLRVESRESEFLASADSKIYKLPCSTELVLEKEKFNIKLVQTFRQDFAATLRRKLMWGLDRRN
jgi:NAD+ kinase